MISDTQTKFSYSLEYPALQRPVDAWMIKAVNLNKTRIGKLD